MNTCMFNMIGVIDEGAVIAIGLSTKNCWYKRPTWGIAVAGTDSALSTNQQLELSPQKSSADKLQEQALCDKQ